MKRLSMKTGFISLIAFSLFMGTAYAQDPAGPNQRLCWDHDGQDLAGFRLLYGTASGNYTESVDVGMPDPGSTFGHPQAYCSKTFSELAIPDGSYYWNVVAYDVVGNVSGSDGEVATLPLDLTAPNQATNLTVAPN